MFHSQPLFLNMQPFCICEWVFSDTFSSRTSYLKGSHCIGRQQYIELNVLRGSPAIVYVLKHIKYARAQDSTFSFQCFLRDSMMQWYSMNYKQPLIMPNNRLKWNMEYNHSLNGMHQVCLCHALCMVVFPRCC